MVRDTVKKTIVCSKCGISPLVERNASIACQNGHKFNIKERKIFFVNAPENAPTPKKDMSFVLNKKLWSDWRRSNFEHIKKNILGLPSESIVLDLGAGRSPFREIINERFQNILSLDFYPYDLVDVVADISGKLPIKNNSFDIVLASNVFEHMPDPRLSINECFRVLKPGGILIAQTPFLMALHDEPYDFNRFTKYEINYLLTESGFEKINIISLSDIFDVQKSLNRDFFSSILNDVSGNFLKKISIRALRKIQTSCTKAAQILVKNKRVESATNPKGYGFTGCKPKTV